MVLEKVIDSSWSNHLPFILVWLIRLQSSPVAVGSLTSDLLFALYHRMMACFRARSVDLVLIPSPQPSALHHHR